MHLNVIIPSLDGNIVEMTYIYYDFLDRDKDTALSQWRSQYFRHRGVYPPLQNQAQTLASHSHQHLIE